MCVARAIWPHNEPVYRFNVSCRKREQVPGCEKVLAGWFVRCALVGLDTNDSPLVQLMRGWADIYALDLDLP